MIFIDAENPLEKGIQIILKKAESTTLLFGDIVKRVIDSLKNIEKVSRDLNLKVENSVKPSNSLNWRSSPVTNEVSERQELQGKQLQLQQN